MYNEDGTVTVGEHVFADAESFYRSQLFQQGDYRCATHKPEFDDLPLVDPTDCSFGSTTIDPAYDPGALIEVAIVFHLAEMTSGFGHIPDAAVLTQVDIFNEDFGALMGSPGANGNNAGLQFYLATEDPNGNPTTGINRYVNNTYFNDPGGAPNQFKIDTIWDPDRYFNVWVNDASGALGYAVFPQQSAGTDHDGVVLLWSSVGRNSPNPPFDQGRTGTHEAGHYFGLFHTFQSGCGSSSQPYTTGDLIADTNQESNPTFGCPGGQQTCGSLDPIDNYMDYSDDTCMEQFTAEQVNRMRCAIQHYRPNLHQPQGAPSAEFSYSVNNLMVTFTDLSVDPDGTVVSWLWDFGDGNTSTQQNPTHTYATTGVYTVTLTVVDNDGRSGAASQQVPVGNPPMAAFAFSVDGLGVAFNDTSTDSDGTVNTWQWNFGDGTSSTQQNPFHIYPSAGTYTATLRAFDNDGLFNVTSMDVTTVLPPVAAFNFSLTGLTVAFSDQSTNANGGITAWQWDFGDGNTSNEQNPTHSYAAGGVYAVRLTVTNESNATATETSAIAVNAPPLAGFSFTVDDMTVTFTNESMDNDGVITSRSWDFGDGESSSDNHPTHTYAADGTYTVTLDITDNSTNESTVSMDVTIGGMGGMPDAGPVQPDAGGGGGGDGDGNGCGCSVGGAENSQRKLPWQWSLLLGLGLIAIRRRRK